MPINKNIEFKQKENLNFNNQNKNELILPKHNDKAINKININKNKTNNIKTIIGKNNKNNFNKDIFQKNINYQEINQYNNIESINHNKVNILI